jgi:hypothetical protein
MTRHRTPVRSADRQPAVSRTGSRQVVGDWRRRRIANPRYGRLPVRTAAVGALSRRVAPWVRFRSAAPRWLILGVALLVGLPGNAGECPASITSAPPCLELRDQFDNPQKLSFPAASLTVLAIADKQGSEHIAGWVAPLRQRFGERIDIRGIADLSGVPGPLRGFVRRKFRRSQVYPVMLDWSGEAARTFACSPGRANIVVLDRQGQILQRCSGPANDGAIQDLCDTIERALEGRPLRHAPQGREARK